MNNKSNGKFRVKWAATEKFFLPLVLMALDSMLLSAQPAITHLDPADPTQETNNGDIEATNLLNYIPTGLSWAAQVENERRADEEHAIAQAQAELRDAMLDATNAQMEVQRMRKNFLDLKKLIPRDPWREIYGEKKYVLSPNSGFVKFSGQILEVAQNGIRVLGQKGDATQVEYFVINFPYPFKEGESVDLTRIYVALEDGDFSYVTEDGYAKTIPKLNYGRPCARPKNADAIELAAQQLTPQEEAQVASIQLEAKSKKDIAIAAQKHVQELLENLRLDKRNALKADQEQAGQGDPEGLRRMGERYRDGDGVEKDLNKAAEYYKKAEDVEQAAADRDIKRTQAEEQQAIKQKFLRNLTLADKFGNIESMIYLSRCYSNGIGTEIDLSKGKEYFDKAINARSQPAFLKY